LAHWVQIQRPFQRLRKTALGIALGLALIHLGMFIFIYMLLNNQKELVSSVAGDYRASNMPTPNVTWTCRLQALMSTFFLMRCCFMQVNNLGLMGEVLDYRKAVCSHVCSQMQQVVASALYSSRCCCGKHACTGKAGILATEIATLTRTIQQIYSGDVQPTLR
jgi:hypothetical protein